MNEKKIKECIAQWKLLQKSMMSLRGESYNNGYDTLEVILKESLNIFKLCDFNIGDEIILIKTPVIDKDHSPGWMGAKHFLKMHAKGKVVDREFYDGKFIAFVEFYDDSYINNDGLIIKSDKPAQYRLSSDYIKVVLADRECKVEELLS